MSIFTKLFQKSGRFAIPQFSLLQVEPTTRCNLNCVMCPWRGQRHGCRDMTPETFQAVSSSFQHTKEIDFTGAGEPLRNPNLETMVRTAKSFGCKVGFSSNGLLLKRDRLEALLAEDLDWIAISMDAATPGTYEKIRVGGSMENLLENLRNLKDLKGRRCDKKPFTMIFFVMMKENFHELPALIELASELDIDHVVVKNLDVQTRPDDVTRSLIGLDPDGSLSKELGRIFGLAHKKALKFNIKMRIYEIEPLERPICEQNPLQTLFISFDGFVSPCITLCYLPRRYFLGMETTAPIYRFGNVNQMSMEEIFSTESYRQFRKTFESRLSSSQVNRFDPSGFSHETNAGPWKLPPPPPGCESCYYLYGI